MKAKNQLLERIISFTLSTVSLTKELPNSQENVIFTNQIIRSVSSIGANYSEAIFAHTRAEFVHLLNICRKESNETLYWLMLIERCNPTIKPKALRHLMEGEELLKIFIASIKTVKQNSH